MSDPKVKLLHEWDDGKDRYRLLAKARMSKGYEDEYIVDKLGQDSFGEPRWDFYYHWLSNETAPGDRIATMLVGIVKKLLQETK